MARWPRTIGPANAVWRRCGQLPRRRRAAVDHPEQLPDRPRAASGERLPIMAQVERALRFVRGHRTVATLIGVGFGNSFAFGAVLGLLVPYGVTELGLAEKDARIGLLYGATGIGALVAGVVFAPAVPHRSGPLAHADHAAPLLGGGGRARRRVGLDRRRAAADRVLLVDRHHHQRRHHVPPAGRARRPALERERARPHDRRGAGSRSARPAARSWPARPASRSPTRARPS